MVRFSPKVRILFTIAPLVALVDQLSKAWILTQIELHEVIPVIPGLFNLTHTRNTGAAFGLFSQLDETVRVPFFYVVPLIALGLILFVLRSLPPSKRWLSVGLAGVVGGAIGNLIDRVRLGYVVDFLDFYWKQLGHFATFNIADAAICIGVGILVLDMLWSSDESGEVSPSAQDSNRTA